VLILLPPSEGKTAPSRGRPLDVASLGFPALTPARTEVLDALVTVCTTDRSAGPDRAAQLLGLGPTLTGEVTRNAHLRSAPTARVDRVYSGVLYRALDVTTLSAAARRRATAWVTVASGLFGLVRLDDRIPAYRLSGNVALPGVGPVSTFWGRHLGPVVAEAAGDGLVVDLRSSTYSPFWRPPRHQATRVVVVRVLLGAGGRRQVVSHLNKATKGRLVRSLLEDGGRPRTPALFAEQLGDLGWKVELGSRGKQGTPLDVVVAGV
jgi:uncharacterized protein